VTEGRQLRQHPRQMEARCIRTIGGKLVESMGLAEHSDFFGDGQQHPLSSRAPGFELDTVRGRARAGYGQDNAESLS